MENYLEEKLFNRFADDDYQAKQFLIQTQRKYERKPNPRDVLHIEFHNNLNKIFGL